MKRWLMILFDIKNALRVLEIMDKAGCHIEQVELIEGTSCYYRIKCPYWVTEEQAKDLKKICQGKGQYTKRNPLWYKLIFRDFHEWARIFWWHE